jgi:hypothetical protein
MTNMNITVINQNFIAVQGTDAKQILIETNLLQEAGLLKTFLSLTKDGTPISFNQAFSSLKLTQQNDGSPDDGPHEKVGTYSKFQFGAEEGALQSVGEAYITQIIPVISNSASEGNYVIHFEARDEFDAIVGSTDVQIKIVSVETALFQYEDMLQQLSEAEITDIEAQYANLESLRQVVNAAILSLPAEQQPSLMTRYYNASSNQYASFKLIKLYQARENTLTVAKAKNVGGNAPFSIVFRDAVCIGDAAEAYLFYPGGYRAIQTGIYNYPSDQPDNIVSSLTPGQTSLAVGNGYVQGGQFALVFKISGVWYHATYEMNQTGTELVAVNGAIVNIPTAGEEWLSPLESAMQNAIAGTSVSMVINPEIADKEEVINAIVTATYPVFEAAINNDILLDALVTVATPLPVGATIELKNNNVSIGTYVATTANVSEFFISEAFGIPRHPLNGHSGKDEWEMSFSHFGPGEFDFTVKSIAAQKDEFAVQSTRYTLASYSEGFRVVDRRAALDAVIAGTSITFSGDVIRSVGETIEISVTTTYPVFSPDLDHSLAVDTLLTLSKPMPVGATLQVYADDRLLGTYTEVAGTVQSYWLNDIINTANLRSNLVDRDGGSLSYKYVFTGLVDNDYNLSLKTIAALQPNFESVDARYVLASKEIPMTITDKSILLAKIGEAETLLITHQPGEAPGCAAAVPRMNLQTHIDSAAVIRDNGDASRNEILDAIADLTAAIVDFKTYIVKWRVNKGGLQTSVDTAGDLLATTTAGTGIGQASSEAIATYQAAYENVLATLKAVPDFVDYFDTDTFNAYQAQIDAAKTAIDAATVVFQDARISTEDYAIAKVTVYENAAREFYDSIRKKIRI